MLQRWVEEAPAAQPFHMVAKVVLAPQTNNRKKEVEGSQVSSQVAQAGSQCSGQ
jgi:hypothetical protein